MAVNRDKPDLWKSDVAQSVDMYNQWFLDFAPAAFRTTRVKTTQEVEHALRQTDLLRNVEPEVLKRWPEVLPTLRMSTCPPIAADRLIGLSGVPSSLVKTIEHRKKMPDLLEPGQLDAHLRSIGAVIERLADPDIFVWLGRKEPATETEITRAATIVADRLCGAVANPIIRNAQERRQLATIGGWLQARGYVPAPAAPTEAKRASFCFCAVISMPAILATKRPRASTGFGNIASMTWSSLGCSDERVASPRAEAPGRAGCP